MFSEFVSLTAPLMCGGEGVRGGRKTDDKRGVRAIGVWLAAAAVGEPEPGSQWNKGAVEQPGLRANAKAHRPPPTTSAGCESGVRLTHRIRNGDAGRRFGGATG